MVLKYKWAPTRSNKCPDRLSCMVDLVSGVYWNIYMYTPSHHTICTYLTGSSPCQPRPENKRRLIRSISGPRGRTYSSLPLEKQIEFDVSWIWVEGRGGLNKWMRKWTTFDFAVAAPEPEQGLFFYKRWEAAVSRVHDVKERTRRFRFHVHAPPHRLNRERQTPNTTWLPYTNGFFFLFCFLLMSVGFHSPRFKAMHLGGMDESATFNCEREWWPERVQQKLRRL